MDKIEICNICDKALECATLKVVAVKKRGLRSFVAKSKEIGDRKWKIWSRHTSVLVHTACRNIYSKATIKNVAAKAAKLKALSTSSAETPSTSARISESPLTKNKFNFRDLCLICAKPWKEKNKQGSVIHNDYMKVKLLNIAKQRDDDISIDVQHRLKYVNSLVAVGARYHNKCYVLFLLIPTDTSNRTSETKNMDSDFQFIAEHIKNSQKGTFTANELLYLKGSRCFSQEFLYRKLKEYFREDIYILRRQGHVTLILYKCFSVSDVCGIWYRNPNSLNIKQQEALVNAVTEIVRKTIKNE
ncbi:PREDICTED: uncharacterized protein LOC106792478 isoform X1 [Polistes canadensis]|uniref:uncharacterized protein LOC106792478 isoform X1 n=1 Tax=Polistes canadensis TaxID=91411 RepID=UPI000718DEF7|nr:PREDICTED: uncharacterized protein LOC106792478 isoform X1 [Polistes canadensis]